MSSAISEYILSKGIKVKVAVSVLLLYIAQPNLLCLIFVAVVAFFGWKKIDRQQKKKGEKRRTDRKELMKSKVYVSFFFFTSVPSCLFSSLLPSSFVSPEEEFFCRKRSCIIVCLCFVVLANTFP